MSKERVLKVFAQREKGLITESEMWLEIVEIADWVLDDLEVTEIEIGINEGIAR